METSSLGRTCFSVDSTADTLGAFFAERLTMVHAYRGALPKVERLFQQIFARHMNQPVSPYS